MLNPMTIRLAMLAILLLLSSLARLGSASGTSQVPEHEPSDKHSTQIVLLGTGTPNADPDRSGPSVAIVVNDTPYLVDFGPGVVRRAAAAYRKGIKGLEVKKLNRAFVTHLHSDHTAGYPDLILTPWVLERTDPLEVFGPKGIKAMTEHLVKAFRVDHGSWPEAYGYRFETGDRTIVISGDSRPSKSVIENCNGCDVLIHEVYSEAGFARRPPEWQKYHSRYHTSSGELAQIATRARPGLLVLYHQLFWGTSEEDLLREIRTHYSGRVVSGHDLDVY